MSGLSGLSVDGSSEKVDKKTLPPLVEVEDGVARDDETDREDIELESDGIDDCLLGVVELPLPDDVVREGVGVGGP